MSVKRKIQSNKTQKCNSSKLLEIKDLNPETNNNGVLGKINDLQNRKRSL